jgi:hypothetical protein
MANESFTVEMNTEADWDGASLANFNRDAAIVTGKRYYKVDIVGPHGILAADLGGLLSPVAVKLVGIASSSWNPESKARVVASDATSSFRQEITLKPAIQYVVLYPGDRLSFLTKDGGRVQIVLNINEMNEQDAIEWGLRHEPYVMPTRFRIIRQAGAAFAPNLVTTWQPNFAYDANTGILTVADNSTGVIPATSLCLYPRWQGCYVSIRYAGSSGDGKLHMVDGLTHKSWVADTAMVDVKWSTVQFVSHDDGIALEATAAVAGQPMVCDIEVALVHPGNRLCGRYQGGL